MAARIDLHISIVAIPWQLTHLLHNGNHSKTRPLKLKSFIFFPYIQAGFMLSTTLIFFFLHELFNYRIQLVNTIWKRKQIAHGRWAEAQNEYNNYGIQSTHGIPPWKIGAAFLSRPLFRVFPLGDSVVRAAAKFGSSVTVRLRELTEALDTSNWRGILTGLGDTFFPFSWRTKTTTMTSNFTWRSSNGHIFNLPLLHNSRNPHTTLRRWLTRWWSHST